MSYSQVLSLAGERHGVITLTRTRAEGISDDTVWALSERGLLTVRARGVFVAAGAPETYEQQVAIAIAAAGRGRAAGACAARICGYGRPHTDHAPPEIAIPRSRSRRDAVRHAIVHRSIHMALEDVTTRGPLPITAPPRTVIDCIGRVSDEALYAIADDVLYRAGRGGPAMLRAAFVRTGRTAGRGHLERILAPWEHKGPRPESPKEISLARVLLEAGLPLPHRQVEIRDPATGRILGRADHAYPAEKIAIEYLGSRHDGVRQQNGDILRDQDLQTVGWVAAYARARNLSAPGSDDYVAEVTGLLRERAPGRILPMP